MFKKYVKKSNSTVMRRVVAKCASHCDYFVH